jgi:VanZ like family.
MRILKLSFYISNLFLFIFYLYPGSIFGCFLYNDCNTQPQLTSDFIIFSSNHVYVFVIFSLLGIFSFKKDLKKISYYLFSVSIFLEFMHIFVPNRGFEVADLLGNVLGVMLSIILYKLFTFRRSK